MKWCRAQIGERVTFGLVEDDEVVEVEGSPFDRYRTTSRRHPLAAVRLLVPAVPANFYAIGVNYAAHIEWANRRHRLSIALPAQADIGYRSPNALIATGEPIVVPKDAPGPVEFEGEVVAVVGRRARHLSEDEALGCLLGLTLGNDVSERAWQRSDRTLWRAKNADTFKPMGPVVATGLDPMRRHVAIRLNGRVVSEYDTGAMLFSVQHYLSRISRYITLHPGDVIWLGTDGPTEPALSPGDVVEVEDPDIGVLRNPVVREA
jgi:2-keto-4-pentenoate hydratase/2-oxohepta-3-ene-1,7-dioic acid hydratase in catechol pathway